MKQISLDNGNTLLSASEAIKEIESKDLWQMHACKPTGIR